MCSTLVDALRKHAAQHPDCTVYHWLSDGEVDDVILSFGELDQRARALAFRLQQMRLQGNRALLCYAPGLDFIVAFFACLYSGVTAVPAYAPHSRRDISRLKAIARDCSPAMILTTCKHEQAAANLLLESPSGRGCLVTDTLDVGGSDDWIQTELHGSDVAYLQYTSGSTTTPKGVMISHANLLANLSYIDQSGGFDSKSVSINWLPHFHDMGLIYGILQPIYSRFPAYLFPPAAFVQQPLRWLEAISKYRGTHSGGPNFAYDFCCDRVTEEQLEELDLHCWKIAFNGSEPIHRETLDRFTRKFSPCGFRSSTFFPVYGLAEATLMVTTGLEDDTPVFHCITISGLEQNKVVPASLDAPGSKVIVGCGRAVSPVELAIVNPATHQLCNPDEVGEIWIAGTSVALGYWKQKEETERTYRAHLANESDKSYLRTGDLGYLQGRELFVTGRLKDCLIIRGQNHYPQDIELTIETCHSAIRRHSTAAFCVGDREEQLVIAAELNRHYSVPVSELANLIRQAVSEAHELQVSRIILLGAGSLPKTSSGKIQRQLCKKKFLKGSLPAIAVSTVDFGTPATPRPTITMQAFQSLGTGERFDYLQRHLRQLAAHIMRVPIAAMDPSLPLVALGVDSLTSIQIKHGLERDLNISVPVNRLLSCDNLQHLTAALLEQIETGTTVKGPSACRRGDGELPLSSGEQRLWFLQHLDSESTAYNEILALRLTGSVNLELLEQSVNHVIARHEICRTNYVMQGERVVRAIHRHLNIQMPRFDFRGLPKFGQDNAWEHKLQEMAAQPFELASDILLRIAIFQLGEQEYILGTVVHHIICDGWSLRIFAEELVAAYQVLSTGGEMLPPLPLQYADYVLWQNNLPEETIRKGLQYWADQLAELPVLELPADPPCGTVHNHGGEQRSIILSTEHTQKLRRMAEEQGATLFMALAGCLQLLLSRYSGQKDIAIGTPTVNRSWESLRSLIGFFANTIVLRTRISGNPTFADLLSQVRATVLEALAQEAVPFEKVVEKLQLERDAARPSLFQVAFSMLPPVPAITAANRFGLQPTAVGNGRAKFDLHLIVEERDEGLRLALEFSTRLFSAGTAERMLVNMRTLLEAIPDNRELGVFHLPLLSSPEVDQLLIEWNNTQRAYPANSNIVQLFEGQVKRTPEAVAVVCEEQRLTYGELNRQANQLAHYLMNAGVRPEVRVALCVERSLEMVVALLGILKAGGVYVPLDANYPAERLAWTLEDTEASVLLTRTNLKPQLPPYKGKTICVDAEWPKVAGSRDADPVCEVHGENFAYVIYTSGSTGKPKGVGIRHSSAVVLLHWAREVFSGEELSGVLASTSLCFDLSVFEIFVPLSWGGKAIIANDALELPKIAARDEVTLVNTVPSAMRELLRMQGVPQSVITVNLAGETLTSKLVEQVYSVRNIQRVVNLYGPSEDTTYSTLAWLTKDEGTFEKNIPIGKPLANTRVYVVDEEMELTPVGVPGELYIGGEGLARGYLNRPELTAERFIPDPFMSGKRLYRTGDRVRWVADGNLEFLGRLDHQVKVRGFRIELGEIESALQSHPQITESVVLACEDQIHDKYLVAYVIGRPCDSLIDTGKLREYLKTKLPGYMVPQVFTQLSKFPLSPNGKLDRRALPQPSQTAPQVNYAAPRTIEEEVIAGIWENVLGVKGVGRHDNFFNLGGHSLLAISIIARIFDSLRVEVPLRKLFDFPTVEGVADYVARNRKKSCDLQVCNIEQADRTKPLLLSFAQQRLWLVHQIRPESPAYNMHVELHLAGPLDVGALQMSLRAMAARHEVLRTTFPAIQGTPVQQIAEKAEVSIERLDLRNLPEAERTAEARRLAQVEAGVPFQIERGPLFRVNLLQLEDQQHALLVTVHHIVCDGWSVGIMVRELSHFYRIHTGKPTEPLPELPIQYADYSQWQRQESAGQAHKAQLQYWIKQMHGLEPLEFPADHARPAQMSYVGDTVSLRISPQITAELRELSRREGATLFLTLLTAFHVLLYRYVGRQDIAIGTPVAGRRRLQMENLIGCFVNTVVLRNSIPGSATLLDALRHIRATTLEAYAFENVPFETIVDALQPGRDVTRSPLVQVMFALQESPLEVLELPDLAIKVSSTETQNAKFDFYLGVSEQRGGLNATLEFASELFERSTMERFLEHYSNLLSSIVKAPSTQISEIEILSAKERQHILTELNQTAVDYGDHTCVHQLCEQQAGRSPDLVALRYGDEELSYGELNYRANQLARYLSNRGVENESVVALKFARGMESVIAALAVLKAGAAYLPIDPNLPEERQQFMMGDAKASVLLTQKRFAHQKLASVSSVNLDGEWDGPSRESGLNLNKDVMPQNLAYLIYTSGSTGRPKGVEISHAGLTNLVKWHNSRYCLSPRDRMTQFAAHGFDAAVWETWTALAAGSSLHIVSDDLRTKPDELCSWLLQQEITISFLPTPMAEAALRVPWREEAALRVILTGGDRLHPVPKQKYPFELINHYGPTESTVVTTAHSVHFLSDVAPFIGRPIANTEVYLLDQNLEAVPRGLPGEMYIGGAGLARCYTGDPELTAEKFVPHPFTQEPGARLYRTGDLARHRTGGEIEFLDRIDQQVKLHGFRIELGEIEAALEEHATVDQAIAVVHQNNNGRMTIAAYVYSKQSAAIDITALRKHLQARLPVYMVPAAITSIAEVPLTANGKVDRNHFLTAAMNGNTRTYVPARNATEEALCSIWQEVLGLEKVGIFDDFFELGGNSLLATQVASRIRTVIDVNLPLSNLFRATTISDIAQLIQEQRPGTQPLSQKPVIRRFDRSSYAVD